MTQEQLMAMVRELIASQTGVIAAERAVDAIGDIDADTLDSLLEKRTRRRQQLAIEIGAFLAVIRRLGEERCNEYARRLE